MQIRCLKCHMPISMNRDSIFAALDAVADDDLSHFDIHCPKCRRMNRVSKNQLLRAAPTWKRDREDDKTE